MAEAAGGSALVQLSARVTSPSFGGRRTLEVSVDTATQNAGRRPRPPADPRPHPQRAARADPRRPLRAGRPAGGTAAGAGIRIEPGAGARGAARSRNRRAGDDPAAARIVRQRLSRADAARDLSRARRAGRGGGAAGGAAAQRQRRRASAAISKACARRRGPTTSRRAIHAQRRVPSHHPAAPPATNCCSRCGSRCTSRSIRGRRSCSRTSISTRSRKATSRSSTRSPPATSSCACRLSREHQAYFEHQA